MLINSTDRIALALAEARAHGTTIDPGLAPYLTEPQAQNLQLAALMQFDPEIVGYTIVGNHPMTRTPLGLSAPIFGWLPSRGLAHDGATIRLPKGIIGAQTEVVLSFGRNFPELGEAIDRETVASAIAALQPAIGLVGRRTPAPPLTSAAAIADFALHVATVAGRPVPAHWQQLGPVTAEIDGRVVANCIGDHILDCALDATVWLAERLRDQGRQIAAGDIVATGSILPILQVLPGQRMQLIIEGIGQVRATLD
jgi:2-keto-4-pentenoate hydratase